MHILMFFFTLIITLALYGVPALLSYYGFPAWEPRMSWLIGWVVLVVVIFFIGLMRKPDEHGHGHAPLGFLMGMILGMAINISILELVGGSLF